MAQSLKFSRKNSKGFTLVELMISLAVAAVMLIGLMTLTQNIQEETKGVYNSFESILVFNELQGNLDNSSRCAASFSSNAPLSTLSGGHEIKIFNPDNPTQVLYERNKKVSNNAFEVKNVTLSFKNPSPTSGYLSKISDTRFIYDATLRLTLKDLGKKSTLKRDFSLFLALDKNTSSQYQIAYCYGQLSAEALAQKACESLGGNIIINNLNNNKKECKLSGVQIGSVPESGVHPSSGMIVEGRASVKKGLILQKADGTQIQPTPDKYEDLDEAGNVILLEAISPPGLVIWSE